MENTVVERINTVLVTYKKTPNSLANMLVMTPSTVNRQLKGDQALSSKVVEGVLATFPEVSAEWLMRGRGEMLIADNANNLANMQEKDVQPGKEESLWQAKYEELEKRYDQLLSILGGSLGKRNVG